MSYLPLKFTFFLKCRLIFHVFFWFCIFVNKHFPYLKYAYLKKEPAESRAFCALSPARLTHHWYASYMSTGLTCLCAFTLTIKCLTRFFFFFVLSCVVSIVTYGIRLTLREKCMYLVLLWSGFFPHSVLKFGPE